MTMVLIFTIGRFELLSGWLTYNLVNGGHLIPIGAVPGLSAMLLLASGLMGLAGFRRTLKK